MSLQETAEEIRTLLIGIGGKLDYQNKLYEEAMMSQQEKRQTNVAATLAPLQAMKAMLENSAALSSSPATKKLVEDMGKAIDLMGAVT